MMQLATTYNIAIFYFSTLFGPFIKIEAIDRIYGHVHNDKRQVVVKNELQNVSFPLEHEMPKTTKTFWSVSVTVCVNILVLEKLIHLVNGIGDTFIFFYSWFQLLQFFWRSWNDALPSHRWIRVYLFHVFHRWSWYCLWPCMVNIIRKDMRMLQHLYITKKLRLQVVITLCVIS